ncbi:nucleotide sugar dehydrogenase, partial [Candidatus Woesearchaeota archaeon]|nr:nucleotide sugar dehydrogenase [Candidatus Woesearchaeota archaeon]
MFKHDVCIVGGCGHVGLPLALSFAKKKKDVVALDINEIAVDMVCKGKMPFIEPHAQPILEQVLKEGNFTCTTDDKKIYDSEYLIIVPGTPLDFDFVPDLTQMEKVVKAILPHLRKGHVLVFRSTLAPRSTDYIKRYIESQTSFVIGKDVFLSFAPERIVQSDAIKEIEQLPQIIGTYDDLTYEKVKKLFDAICPETLQTTPLEAELAKLFTNNYRYVSFALANEFYMIASSLGANIFNILNALNHNYPRANVPRPGLAKGPCLGKDAWILLSASPSFSSFTGIISSAFRVNEGVPSFLVGEIKKRTDLAKAKVAVLGLTFKRDCDDIRDSLSMKLIKILKNEYVDYETHDPFVDKKDLKSLLKDKDVVIIAINHSIYEDDNVLGMVKKGTLIVDIWNTQKKNEV